MSFSIEIKAPADLSGQEISLWDDFRAANPALYSPYFHFGYTELLGRLRQDVHVLVIRNSDAPIAFLPFQGQMKNNGKIGFARPIGAPMTDYQGFVCGPDTEFDILSVLKQAGFGAFHFSALIDQAGQLSNYARSRTQCAVADISGGADQWREARDASYRRHLKSNRRRIRNAEELGERNFKFKSNNRDVFDQLITWKREKFTESGKYDVLSADWTISLLEELWSRENEADLRADMHALYFGDRLAAIDLGLTDGTVFHSWIVAYDNDLQHLAPGIQLLEGLIDAGQELGYKRIDLGEGLDGYKRHYASEEIYVGSGFIAASGPAAALSKVYGATEKFGEQRLGNFGKLPGKARRRYAQISACEPDFGGRAKAVLAAVTGSRR